MAEVSRCWRWVMSALYDLTIFAESESDSNGMRECLLAGSVIKPLIMLAMRYCVSRAMMALSLVSPLMIVVLAWATGSTRLCAFLYASISASLPIRFL